MALPGVTIEVNSEGRQLQLPLPDGTFELICTATAVSGASGLTLNKSYLLNSLDDLKALGATTQNNAHLYLQVADFFANHGYRLWLRCVAETVALPDMVDATKTHGKTLIDDSHQRIRCLLASKKVGSAAATMANGLDAKVHDAVGKAQQLADSYSSIHLAVILDGKEYSGTAADLTDYSSSSYENVALTLAANDERGNAAVGMLGGILSALDVEQRLSRKLNGAAPPTTGYLTDKKTLEESLTSLGVIHEKHYITYRLFQGEAGVYFANDFTLSGGFVNRLSRVRVIDKIKRVAYQVGVREIDNKVPLNAEGTLREDVAKRIETDIEQAIGIQLVESEAISTVTATIGSENILETEQLTIELAITPVGYSNSINYLIYI